MSATQLVVPALSSTNDLLSLAEASRACLCAPCLLRIALLLPRPHYDDDDADTDASDDAVPPVGALVELLAGQGRGELLEELVGRCPGLPRVLAGPSRALCAALAAAAAAPAVPPLVLRTIASVFSRLSSPSVPLVARTAVEALVGACRAGGARAALCARELTRPPLCAHRGHRDLVIDALCAACATSSVEAMKVLAAAPYRLGHDDALRKGRSGKFAVDCACERGSVAVLETLAQPPFSVICYHPGVEWTSVFTAACQCKSAGPLRRLALRPYMLGHEDASSLPEGKEDSSCWASCTGTDIEQWQPHDWEPVPPLLASLADAELCEWSLLLSTAWVLRQLVVPALSSTRDLLSLAEASRACLCAPCLLRIALLLPRPHYDVDDADTDAYDDAVPPVGPLLELLAGQGRGELLEELVGRCPGLPRVLAGPSRALCSALAAAAAAPAVPPLVLRSLASVIARLSNPSVPLVARAAAEALVGACRAGGARAALCARELARPPLCAHSGPRDLLVDALCAACATSSVEAMGVLAAAPYRLGHDDALRWGRSGKCAVDCACECGSVAVLEVLAQSPFSVCRDDLLQRHLNALKSASQAGRADIVARLSQAPSV
eukprot:m51a1_g10774 hypothetical protein (609) ;mRNA; f:2366-10335